MTGALLEETANANAQESTASLAGKYLTFALGEESYAIGILKVQEIIGVMSVTRIPRTPHFVRGVINLRGKVIPVMDLRLKFELDAKEDTERTCIVVVQIDHEDIELTMGILVDEVSEVINIDAKQIENPPRIGGAVDTTFILGMGKIGDQVVILLDVDRVLSTSELVAANATSQQG